MKSIGREQVLYVLRTRGKPDWSKIGVSKRPWTRARTEGRRINRAVEISGIWVQTNGKDHPHEIEWHVKNKMAKRACLGTEWFACPAQTLKNVVDDLISGKIKRAKRRRIYTLQGSYLPP